MPKSVDSFISGRNVFKCKVHSQEKTVNRSPRFAREAGEPLTINKRQRRFGFTLIELLVVIAVMATLAGAIIYSTNNARNKGKDARRKEDLKAVSSALVSYYADHGQYPEDGSNPVVLDYASESEDNWIPGLDEYLPKQPKDPLQALTGGLMQKTKLALNLLTASFSTETYTANNSSPKTQVVGTATATLGETSIGPIVPRCCPAGRLTGSLFLMPNDGTVSSMSVYIGEVDSAQNHYTMAIYSNIVGPTLGGGLADMPGSPVANTDQGVLLSPNTWNTLPVTANLTANTKYWLLFNTNGTNIPMGFLTDRSVPCGVGFLAPNLNQFPDGTNQLLDTNLNSIYATYTHTTPGASQTPLCTPTGPPPPPTTECSDTVDNADPEDTLVDMADPGCSSSTDDNETDSDLPGGGSSGICDNKSAIYCYRVSLDRKNFILWAQLENLNDPDIYDSPADTATCNDNDTTTVPPLGNFLNYCIRSPR